MKEQSKVNAKNEAIEKEYPVPYGRALEREQFLMLEAVTSRLDKIERKVDALERSATK